MAVDIVTVIRELFDLALEERFFIYSMTDKRRYGAKFMTSGLKVADCQYSDDTMLHEIMFNPKVFVEKTTNKDGAMDAIDEISSFLFENKHVKGAKETKSALEYVKAFIEAGIDNANNLQNEITELQAKVAELQAFKDSFNFNANTDYVKNNVIKVEDKFYVCKIDHVSGESFDVDIDNWQLVEIAEPEPEPSGD